MTIQELIDQLNIAKDRFGAECIVYVDVYETLVFDVKNNDGRVRRIDIEAPLHTNIDPLAL